MENPPFVKPHGSTELKTVEMHTTGEPTRIVYSGFPDIPGTLLEQRALAQSHHDHIRRSLIYEPRGHNDMYGAVLRPNTELVAAGEAHMGVLFLTHEGYSTMCGHATFALGRFLVDCVDPSVFPKRDELQANPGVDDVELSLHVPCGLVRVTVPIVRSNAAMGSFRSDPKRPVRYLSVPSFASGLGVRVTIPPSLQWDALNGADAVTVDVAYGGAFYIIARGPALGFPAACLDKPNLGALDDATRKLKAAFNSSEKLRDLLHHPDSPDLQFLYSVIVVQNGRGVAVDGTGGAETGLCFFGDQQVDRSPTGSGVQARVALAVAKGERKLHERWTYHSLLSNASEGKGGFVGRAVEEVIIGEKNGVVVEVSGWASYTGYATWVVEKDDEVGRGFSFDALGI